MSGGAADFKGNGGHCLWKDKCLHAVPTLGFWGASEQTDWQEKTCPVVRIKESWTQKTQLSLWFWNVKCFRKASAQKQFLHSWPWPWKSWILLENARSAAVQLGWTWLTSASLPAGGTRDLISMREQIDHLLLFEIKKYRYILSALKHMKSALYKCGGWNGLKRSDCVS